MSMKVHVDPPNLANDWRWGLAKRVSDAAQLRKSPRLREFLLFVCDRAFAGPARRAPRATNWVYRLRPPPGVQHKRRQHRQG